MSSGFIPLLRSGLSPVEPAPPASTVPQAAVLLIIEAYDPSLPLLFIQRPDHMRVHAGQIAFPGGGRDPGDATLTATALREATEEVALPPGQVRVLGCLPPRMTAVSERWLTPVVALSDGPWQPVASEDEVAEIFSIGLPTLLQAPHQVRSLQSDAARRPVHFYTVEERVIWGVTGAILHDLLGLLGRRD